jgi:hypothetical protein
VGLGLEERVHVREVLRAERLVEPIGHRRAQSDALIVHVRSRGHREERSVPIRIARQVPALRVDTGGWIAAGASVERASSVRSSSRSVEYAFVDPLKPARRA